MDEIERRVGAICKHYGITPKDIGDLPATRRLRLAPFPRSPISPASVAPSFPVFSQATSRRRGLPDLAPRAAWQPVALSAALPESPADRSGFWPVARLDGSPVASFQSAKE